jgi:hypothetical protein
MFSSTIMKFIFRNTYLNKVNVYADPIFIIFLNHIYNQKWYKDCKRIFEI